ncbi:MAG: alanine--tRNA ligase [Eubacteriaceae bacterium]|nr:alanine--tRNA ligase [Eubacteriaceae bacterium]
MQKYGLNELRDIFLRFFESKGHLVLDSFPLIPANDKSLLLINSGMAPLKPYFTGEQTPPKPRVATCQKCIRTPDIENVGKTARHGTFFEMLGNFSFGDYFKVEAIQWAWEFLTEVIGISEDLLYPSVYLEDDEAFAIWRDIVGVPPDKITRLGKEDNFWEIGSGPCGPCSEIYVDRGEKYGCGEPDCKVGCECDRYMEVWNLVFTQFDRDEQGVYTPLEHPNIDTGMGLERLAVFCQGVDNLFEVDTVKSVVDTVADMAGIGYQSDALADVSIRVVTDHVRSTVFMLGDGVIPSNESRGYVLRRLLRRAARHGKLLGIKGSFLCDVAERVIDGAKSAYPNLLENKDGILKAIDIEESRFAEALAQGETLIKEIFDKMRGVGENVLDGESAFKLYDTYGFPLELTLEMAEEEGFSVDIGGYNTAYERQRNLARGARSASSATGWKDEIAGFLAGMSPTSFVGYDTLAEQGTVVAVIGQDGLQDSLEEGEEGYIVFDKTPFYAQSGGQNGDIGRLSSSFCNAVVTNTIKAGDKHAHAVKVLEGMLSTGSTLELAVDPNNRLDIQRNHTATHLLHKALKEVLGEHVNQAGSEVSADRLRFDFTHYEKLSPQQIRDIEDIVNNIILLCEDVATLEMDLQEAKNIGAIALFGEQYSNQVRVVRIGDFSMELCGGTHLKNTGFAGAFKIESEGAIASGIRRIEALTGSGSLMSYLDAVDAIGEISFTLNAQKDNVVLKIKEMAIQNQELAKQLEATRMQEGQRVADSLASSTVLCSKGSYIAVDVGAMDANGLRGLCAATRDKILGAAIVVLFSNEGGKANMVCAASPEIVKAGFNAGSFVKKVAEHIGAKGGGRPDIAQAGISNASSIAAGLGFAKQELEAFLGF